MRGVSPNDHVREEKWSRDGPKQKVPIITSESLAYELLDQYNKIYTEKGPSVPVSTRLLGGTSSQLYLLLPMPGAHLPVLELHRLEETPPAVRADGVGFVSQQSADHFPTKGASVPGT